MNKIGNDYYTVSFEHNIEPKYITLYCGDHSYKVRNKKSSSTLCFLKDEDNNIIFQSELSYKATKSGFYNKEIARTESLLKVLANLDMDQSEEIFLSYWNRRPAEQAMLL